MAGGRPSLKTPEVVEEICARLERGEPMEQICRDAHMPAARTVRGWQEMGDEVSAAIARAREIGFDALAADCLSIADDAGDDFRLGERGGIVTDTDNIQRSKLRVWTRLQLLAKWDPKRYGEKVEQHHTGELVHTIERRIVRT